MDTAPRHRERRASWWRPHGRRRWYREAVTVTAAPAAFWPGPQMSAAELEDATSPTGHAAGWTRVAYIGVWVAQIAAFITALILAGSIVLYLAQQAQATADACQQGDQTRCQVTGVDVRGQALTIIVCLIAVVGGRGARWKLSRVMHRSALRNAHRQRLAQQDRLVLVDELPARSRWLLTITHDLTETLPHRVAEQIVWDAARRLDAAAVLDSVASRFPRHAAAATRTADLLSAQVEGDVVVLRAAVRGGHRFRHARCRAETQRTLPRSKDPETTIRDAALLLPRERTIQETAARDTQL